MPSRQYIQHPNHRTTNRGGRGRVGGPRASNRFETDSFARQLQARRDRFGDLSVDARRASRPQQRPLAHRITPSDGAAPINDNTCTPAPTISTISLPRQTQRPVPAPQASNTAAPTVRPVTAREPIKLVKTTKRSTNTYTGKDPVKRAVQNKKLRDILSDKKPFRTNARRREDGPVLRMSTRSMPSAMLADKVEEEDDDDDIKI